MSPAVNTPNSFSYKPAKRTGYMERVQDMRVAAIKVLQDGLCKYQSELSQQSAVTIDYHLMHEVLNEAGYLTRAISDKHVAIDTIDSRVASFVSVLTVSGLTTVRYAHRTRREFAGYLDGHVSYHWDFMNPAEYQRKQRSYEKHSRRRDGAPDSEPVIPRLLYTALMSIDFSSTNLFADPDVASELSHMFTNFESISGNYRRILKDAEPEVAQNHVLNDIRLSRMVERGDLTVRMALVLGVVTGNYVETYVYARRRYGNGKLSYTDPSMIITTVYDTFKDRAQRAWVFKFIINFLLSSQRGDMLDFEELVAVVHDGMENMPFELVDQMVRITREDFDTDETLNYRDLRYRSPWGEIVVALYDGVYSVKSASTVIYKSR